MGILAAFKGLSTTISLSLSLFGHWIFHDKIPSFSSYWILANVFFFWTGVFFLIYEEFLSFFMQNWKNGWITIYEYPFWCNNSHIITSASARTLLRIYISKEICAGLVHIQAHSVSTQVHTQMLATFFHHVHIRKCTYISLPQTYLYKTTPQIVNVRYFPIHCSNFENIL